MGSQNSKNNMYDRDAIMTYEPMMSTMQPLMGLQYVSQLPSPQFIHRSQPVQLPLPFDMYSYGQGAVPPSYNHHQSMHMPQQHFQMISEQGTSLLQRPPVHTNTFHMAPTQMRPLVSGYTANISDLRNKNAVFDSSESDDIYRYYAKEPRKVKNYENF